MTSIIRFAFFHRLYATLLYIRIRIRILHVRAYTYGMELGYTNMLYNRLLFIRVY